MAYDYDKLYRSERNALGKPTAKYVRFFKHYDSNNARVLDVGCGQGRDALFIARLGHRVLGLDISASGIADLTAASEKENLGIIAEVADIIEYKPDGIFDVILIDRTLHMLKTHDRLQALERLINHVETPGYLLIADEKSNMGGFRQVLDDCGRHWRVLDDKGGVLFVALDE